MTNSVIFANLTEEELETLFMSKDDIICKVFQKLNEKERKEVVKELIKRSKKEVKLQQIEQNRQQKKITNAYKKTIDLKENSNFIKFHNELDNYFLTHNMMNLKACIKRVTDNEKYYYAYGEGKNEKCFKSSSIKIFDENICNCTFLPCKDGIELYRIEVYNTGKGTGSILMNAFNEVSKKTGIKIRLTLGNPGGNKEYTLSDVRKQRNFYHKHGFRRSKNNKYWYNTEIK